MILLRSSFFALGGLALLPLCAPNHSAPNHGAPGKSVKAYPTFAADVAPIIYSKCAGCHHAGEVAPFSLTSYLDARAKARTIAAAVSQRYMPPWQAASHGEFQNERTLSAAQIATLEAWADAGAPAGDLARAPKPPAFTAGWLMGKPDFVGEASAAYPVSSEGVDDYRCFVIPTHFSQDRYVTGVEVRPGDRKIVHHVLLYLDSAHAARAIKSHDGKPGYESFGGPGFVPTGSLGGWAPGIQPQILPPGAGFLLPKGADIVMQVHYHKDGKPEEDLTRIGLDFAKGPVDRRLRWEAVGELLIDIPPGARNFPVNASLRVPRNVTVYDVIPHMHWLGRDMKVTAVLPDGAHRRLIDVDRYDFNWQTRYSYRQPVELPKGTLLQLVAHYDNSAANPHNPNNPPKRVTFGEQTTDEMCFAFFSYTVDSEHLTKGVEAKNAEDFGETQGDIRRIFDRFDADHDGYLDQNELANLLNLFDHGKLDQKGAPVDDQKTARFLIAMFGKSRKGFISKDEFLKMSAKGG